MYYYFFQFIYNLFVENKDAIIALPTSVKTILTIALVVSIGSSIIRKATRFLTTVAIVAVLYFGAVYAGLI